MKKEKGNSGRGMKAERGSGKGTDRKGKIEGRNFGRR